MRPTKFLQTKITTLLVATVLSACLYSTTNAQSLDSYGGWKDIQGRVTGAFHIEKVGERHVLFTPAGNAFVALGVNHLSVVKSHGSNEPNFFAEKYDENWDRFADEIENQFKDWGLNTVDNTVEPLLKKFPYFAAKNFARTAKYFSRPDGPNPYEFPDVFDSKVKACLESEAESFCKLHRDSKNLIAYYWTDTPTWDIHKTRRFRGTDWVSEIRSLPNGSSGRSQYAQFLKERYEGDLNRFIRAYDLQVESFEALATIDFSGLDRDRYEVERDDQAFLGVIAKTYYGIIGGAFHEHDPHHMVFGEKYLLGDLPPQVAEAALPHIDAIAIQPGDGYLPIYTPGDVFPTEELETLHKNTGKPIMICDHQISFATERYPKSIWPFHQRANEKEAAEATEIFLHEAFTQPYIIGYMRCQYIDRFSERRNASKLGLIRDDGSPYSDLVNATRSGSHWVKKTVRKELMNR